MPRAPWKTSCAWRAWLPARRLSTAQYDAAAELIKAKSWPRAIDVLEAFRRDYPKSKQQADVTQKLAVAYMESGRSDAAAGEFERIAQAKESTPEVRLEALNIAAGQYEKSGNTAKTVALLEKLRGRISHPRGRPHRNAAEAGGLRGNATTASSA
jgi:TolA-binding protein